MHEKKHDEARGREAGVTEIVDLTRSLDENLFIYTSAGYSDPPLEIEVWCTVEEQGFEVSRLSMGTQTGTHIDAPAHFVAAGATLDALPLPALIGRYLCVDLDGIARAGPGEPGSGYDGETILFLASSGPAAVEMPAEVFDALLKLPCPVWVMVHGVRVAGRDELYFHRALAQAGKYLIEDVDQTMAARVRAGGEMMALPLRLEGVSGSPCRVVVRQARPDDE